jgi:predicted metal-dependent phosphoesterase TrpH
MHVHSYFSGPCTTPLFSLICRESYSDPEEVYSQLRRSGMSLFTLTDHDSVEGAEKLLRHPDFFMSEEVTCRMPSGTVAHIGVFDINEKQHMQIQQRRNDLVALLMYLTERRILFSVNHVFSGLTGPRAGDDFHWFRQYFPAVETHNSHMVATQNESAAQFARRFSKLEIGGSDAHALPSVGTAFTEVPGARNKEEFFAGLRTGMSRTNGEYGSTRKLTRDLLLIGLEMIREDIRTAPLLPLAILVPVAAFLNYRGERKFSRHWSEKILGKPESRRFPRWINVPQRATEEWT